MIKKAIVDSILGSAISYLLTCVYDIAKKFLITQKQLLCNVWFFVMVFLAYMCSKNWFDLHRFKAIMNKITIRGKEYYDIFEDVVYFQVHKPRNRFMIDTLIWNFDFKINDKCDTYLDLSAKWEISFTANQKQIRDINVGIRGGDHVTEESMKIKAFQNNAAASCQFTREQDDCTYLNVNLNTYIAKKHSDVIQLEYQWEKFIITDRKDDYIYLFPQSLTTDMKNFELITNHPYECKAIVVVLKYKWSGGYDKVEVTGMRDPDLKIKISEEDNSRRHKITIDDVDIKNVYLIIFEKILPAEEIDNVA